MSDNPIVARITQRLRSISDLTLLTLKSQLIIEEQINDVLGQVLSHADALDIGRLTFFQRVQIVRALDAEKGADQVLGFAERLNSIRNRLAHQLEPIGLEDAVSSFVNDVSEAMPLRFEPAVPVDVRMGVCVGYMCGVLNAFQRITSVIRMDIG